VVELGGNGFGKGRRGFLKFLAGLGLGAAGVEVYERLYSIPSLERRFREELNYWVGRYNSAYAELNNLATQLNAAERRIEDLAAQHNAAQRKIEDLTLQIRRLDELEAESTSAISFYQQQLEEAIKGLRNTVEKYRSILGEERVAFESATLKVLEDLKITIEDLRSTNEKLLRLLPHFPLIKDLSWRPTKVVNDKIYDVNVSLEVISPLNSLIEVEVQLIPVEYTHLPMEAFPVEQVKTVKLNPKGSEKELFNATFTDLKGGREYIIKATARDTADRVKEDNIKTTYIREFENFGKLLYGKGVIIGANHFPLYPIPHSWEALEPMAVRPLLGKYNVADEIVISKHIDWATGHGINTFFFSWPLHWGEDSKKVLNNIGAFLTNELSPQLHFSFQVEGVDTAIEQGNVARDGWKLLLSTRSDWEKILTGDGIYVNGIIDLKPFLDHPTYLKVEGIPVLFLFNTARLHGNVSDFVKDIRNSLGKVLLMANYADLWAASSTYTKDGSGGWLLQCVNSGKCELIDVAKNFDMWTVWAAGWYTPIKEPLNIYYPLYINEAYKIWSNLSKRYSKYFVPSVIPGFIDLRNPKMPKLPRDIEMFTKFLITALELNRYPKLIKIDTFNEFGEATGIEPTYEEGFNYLKRLKNVLEEHIQS